MEKKFELKSIGRLELWDGIIESDHEDGTVTMISQNPEFTIRRFDDKSIILYENKDDTDTEDGEIIEFICDRRLSERVKAGNYIKVTVDYSSDESF